MHRLCPMATKALTLGFVASRVFGGQGRVVGLHFFFFYIDTKGLFTLSNLNTDELKIASIESDCSSLAPFQKRWD